MKGNTPKTRANKTAAQFTKEAEQATKAHLRKQKRGIKLHSQSRFKDVSES